MTSDENIKVKDCLFDFRNEYLADFLSNSPNPEMFLSIEGRRWIKEKLQHTQSPGSIVRDLLKIAEPIAKQRHGVESLLNLIDLAFFRLDLTSHPILFAAEQVARARLGEIHKAIHQIDHVGTLDDQLIVHSELALIKKTEGREYFEHHLNVIKNKVPYALPETVEYIVVNLSKSFPEFSIKLSDYVPDPEWVIDYKFEEKPNKSRCLWRIFENLSEDSVERAVYLCHNLVSGVNQVYGWLGVIKYLIKTQSPDLAKYLKKYFSLPAVNLFLRRSTCMFICREAADLPVTRYLNVLGILIDTKALPVVSEISVSAIDKLINRNSRSVSNAILKIKNNELKNVIIWRLRALGIEEELNPECETLLGEDLSKVQEAVEICKSDVYSTQEIIESMNSKIGQIHGFVSMAEQVAEEDDSMAQALCSTCFEFSNDIDSGIEFYFKLDVFRVLVQWSGPFRKETLDWFFLNLENMPPQVMRFEYSFRLGGVISKAFAKWTREEIFFFNYVINTSRSLKDSNKCRVWKGIINGLCESTCLAFGKKLLEGIFCEYKEDCEPNETEIFFTHEAELIAIIAQRILSVDEKLGVALFELSVEKLSESKEDDETVNKKAVNVLLYMFEKSPALAWRIYCKSELKCYVFINALNKMYSSYKDRKMRVQTTWLRCAVAHSFEQMKVENGEHPSQASFKKYMHFARVSNLAEAGQYKSDPMIPNQWHRKASTVFENYISKYKYQDTEHVSSLLHQPLNSLAKSNWSLFMNYIEDEDVLKYGAHVISFDKLFNSLLNLEDPSKIIENINFIRKAKKDHEKDGNTEFRNWLIVCGLVYDPLFATQTFFNISENDMSDIFKKLDYVKPKVFWSLKYYDNLLNALNSISNRKKAIIWQLKVTFWLRDKLLFNVSPKFKDISNELSASEDLVVKYEAVNYLRYLYPQEAADLLIDVLEHANDKNAEIYLKALAYVGNVLKTECVYSTEDAEFHYTLKITLERRGVETNLTANKFLSILKRTQGISRETFYCVVRLCHIASEDDFIKVVKTLDKKGDLENDKKNDIIHHLLFRCIKNGVIIKPETVKNISESKNIIKNLSALASNSKGSKGKSFAKEALSEIENLQTKEKPDALCQLADNLLNDNCSLTIELYMKAFDVASKFKNNNILGGIASHIVEKCILNKEIASSPLPEKIYEVGQIETNKENPDSPYFFEWMEYCSIAAALAVWGYNIKKFNFYMEKVAEGFENQNVTYSEGSSFLWTSSLIEKNIELVQKRYGQYKSEKLLHDIFNLLADSVKVELADQFVSLYLASTSPSQPLLRYNIWKHALKPDLEFVVKNLLPYCSDRVKVTANLRLAIHYYGKESSIYKEYLSKTMQLAKLLKPSSYLDFEKDLWTLYAAAHGVSGCKFSLMKMLFQNDKSKINISGVTVAVLENVGKPGALLNRLWKRITCLEVN